MLETVFQTAFAGNPSQSTVFVAPAHDVPFHS
jgi:hypothetical protein